MTAPHVPVLAEEVGSYLTSEAYQCLVDGTLGCGGHAKALLQAMPQARLLGIDRDDRALKLASGNLAEFGDRVIFKRGGYSAMKNFVDEIGWQSIDAVLLDLGMSSLQLDDPVRGFSFQADGPLDMRMDRRSRTTAAAILNKYDETEIARIFREYGEERHARKLAKAIVHRRVEKPWTRTGELAEFIRSRAGGGYHQRQRAPMRCFQALRIAVNKELEELQTGLDDAFDLLAPGGRLAVISFHSLEDRMVKQKFKYEAAACVCPPGLPECRCGKQVRANILTRKPIEADAGEIEQNRRAASAKLRVAEKLA
ncbi:MAG: 16S rRNA (cytosine(1402)-N(4))-methyltransferase RsmH [Lentisphaeria bacterium]